MPEAGQKRRRRTPKHCHHKPSGRGYLRLDGKTYYTGPWGSSEAQRRYEAYLRQWLDQGEPEALDEPRSGLYTVAHILVDYWVHVEQWYRKDGEPTREVVNIRYALRPVRAHYESLPVVDFGPKRLKELRGRLIRDGLSLGVINQRIGIVKRMFKWGVSEELVPSSVYEALRAVEGLRRGRSAARETAPVRPPERASVDAVKGLVSRQVAAMIELQALTGMRPGEVVRMRACDLDRSGRVWFYRPERHKTQHHGRERSVPLGPKAQTVLAGFLKLDPDAYLFSPREAHREQCAARRAARKTKETPSQRERRMAREEAPKRRLKERYTVATYGRAIRRACEKAGIGVWSPNQLRHLAATELQGQFGIEMARAVLGHSSAVTTEIYAERDREMAARAMEEVG